MPFTRVRLQQLQEQHCLFLPVHGVFLCVQTMVWLPVFGIFNVCTGFDAGSGTQELCTNAVGESALIVDNGRIFVVAAHGTQTHVGIVPGLSV